MRPRVAILPWGRAFEEYLDPLGVSLEQFRTRISGSWLFNYVRALDLAGIDSTILLVSTSVRRTRWTVHEPTGADFVIVPAPLRVRAALRLPRASSTGVPPEHVMSPQQVAVPGRLKAFARELLRYGTTPVSPVLRALRRSRCDAILCQEYEYARFDFCVLAGRLLRIPVFATFQGGRAPEGVLERMVRPHSVRASAGLIIGAAAEARRVRSAYGVADEQIAQIPNPLALEEVHRPDRVAARAELGIPIKAPVLVWHGRVSVVSKGLDLLLAAWGEAAHELAQAGVRLLLIGSGEDDDWLRRRIHESPWADRIIWVERYIQSRTDLFRYLSAGDIYVFPSRYEGFPVAPLEAMACGLPIIGTPASGVEEITGRGLDAGGIQVDGSSQALSRAILSLLQDPAALRSLGAAARRRVEVEFSLQAVGPKLAEWLRSRGLVARSARAG